ncbi:MAG: ATP synthase epsilon chain [Parcubacteria group bacterium GW2011_GWA2_43_17]|nr:MAG: ATP synthase epsilon chain [Parcubacteria group bacterium GW2011_GWA2_43_17]KKT90836.1 MAG: ATP synthase epsilon chain [Parcubacteria group bacterium GW2011_GWF2_45_11]OGY93195.1 MAG: ATP synthase F1 subunit epsilon [Candidatus Komeilibacteria bacterium RIFOXYA2_FULL_45_9]OGY94114.1 MAG: ATP synthase F1 subunit epsilon [Candidatus Komeilibacteria bacterium RIFOXYC2_FULL_45_12]HAH04160.1 F0F1 ATP synthase subunit epsilon [Candidatus Komeilibacteria bacterium]
MKIQFKIATPERVVYEAEIDQITLPTKLGEITILPNHIPLVSALAPGEVLIKQGKEEVPLAVSGGFVELSNNKLVILADTAERVEEIDTERAEQARDRARALLNKKQTADEVDFTALAVKIEKEMARLKVANKYKKIKSRPQIKSLEDQIKTIEDKP